MSFLVYCCPICDSELNVFQMATETCGCGIKIRSPWVTGAGNIYALARIMAEEYVIEGNKKQIIIWNNNKLIKKLPISISVISSITKEDIIQMIKKEQWNRLFLLRNIA